MHALRADVPVECVIDAHVHMPLLTKTKDVNDYIRGLVEAGVGGAVIIGIPPFKDVLSRITIEEVEKEHERVRPLIEKYASELMEHLQPEALYVNALRLAEDFCSFARHPQMSALSNFAPVFPANLSLRPEELASVLEAAAGRGFRGFKVISTLFLQHLDSPQVAAVLEVAQSRGLPVIVHGGCDPGIWELPRFCKYGDPSRLGVNLREHRDVAVIIAHAGGYSAIAPGVFFEETLSLARSFPNIYVDTSALPPQLVPLVLNDFPNGRVLYGSDYPAVSNADLRNYMEEVFLGIMSRRPPRDALESYSHGLAEELFKLSCLTPLYRRVGL
ncbi:MAG: amidohydrolase family protein [Acidilobus sp.]